MGSRTDFEIRHTERGFFVFSLTGWWNENQRSGQIVSTSRGGGLVRVEPFSSEKAAINWVYEQYSVSPDSWGHSDAGTLVSGKGDTLPSGNKAHRRDPSAA